EEDPTFTVRTDKETGQVIIGGMGELHLDVFVDRMKREFKVECNVVATMLSYREKCIAHAQDKDKFERQSGGHGQYGDVHLEYISSVEAGLVDSMENGVLAGYPLVDVKAKLYDGSYHDVDSSEMAFKIAASLALREAAKVCKPVLLEPMMKVEIVMPEEYLGD